VTTIERAVEIDDGNAGRYMNYSDSDPESIATALTEQLATACDYLPVPADGAARAAGLIADLL